ncbi:hypothetical protein [Actinokineospora globicatena]|uniref:hypothetical protein n=1 Tax=Actinokineospora globicatena TaxID=103729 RepID=UPI0020A54AE8|nr:hypothetical protein [Actinokineospora globicatena]MCP2303390.1 hypothetical protein [Actinokineospora globicatena]GLW79476.1 hypothetical protein Aglo01_39580 [Actinokineospora globicatena]GLW86114.1 hypothetical protein Aglo02_37530 [Actinokineospora globicatena]
MSEEISEAVLAAEPRMVAVFVAGCAERVYRRFTMSRGDRARDVGVLVEAVDRLWDLDAPAESFAGMVTVLRGFRELRGDEDIKDLGAFEAVVATLHATEYRATGDPTAALACAHAVRTAMWLAGSEELGDVETARQQKVLGLGDVPLAQVRAEDAALGRAWAAT